MHLPVRPCAARCFAIGLFSALVALSAAPAYAQTDVPSNWPLIPSGLNAGDEFRLLFMGKNPRNADSTDSAVYDAYVRGRIAANGHTEIKAYSSHFKVLGSTATVNARTHTGTTSTGSVPVYWLNGPKVADNYADFYDGSWDDKDGATLEDGTSLTLEDGLPPVARTNSFAPAPTMTGRRRLSLSAQPHVPERRLISPGTP